MLPAVFRMLSRFNSRPFLLAAFWLRGCRIAFAIRADSSWHPPRLDPDPSCNGGLVNRLRSRVGWVLCISDQQSRARKSCGRASEETSVRQGSFKCVCRNTAGGPNCYVFVASDGEENVDPVLRRTLSSSRNRGMPTARIDNSGINVAFCGFAQTRSTVRLPSRSNRISQLEDAWSSVFTQKKSGEFRSILCSESFA